MRTVPALVLSYYSKSLRLRELETQSFRATDPMQEVRCFRDEYSVVEFVLENLLDALLGARETIRLWTRAAAHDKSDKSHSGLCIIRTTLPVFAVVFVGLVFNNASTV